jgi:hypothetical protein
MRRPSSLESIAQNGEPAVQALAKALAAAPYGWLTDAKRRNLRLIREARKGRKEQPLGWDVEIETELAYAGEK